MIISLVGQIKTYYKDVEGDVISPLLQQIVFFFDLSGRRWI
jgi:hypothetical protein